MPLDQTTYVSVTGIPFDVKEKWLAKLRDPGTKQCYAVLGDPGRDIHCALGWLREVWEDFREFDKWWIEKFVGADNSPAHYVAKMNDAGVSLIKIADFVEANL